MKSIRKIFAVCLLVLLTGISFSIYHNFHQNPKVMLFNKKSGYEELWKKVDSLQSQGLSGQALLVVEDIYKKAKEEKNNDQIIKSFIHRLKFKEIKEENAFEKMIGELKEEVKTAEFPNNAVMESMLGEMYWWYYQNNRYLFLNRSNVVNFSPEDIKTWTLNQLADVAISHYQNSLKDKELLQKIPVRQDYTQTIYTGSKPKNLRPTLYDFLANRAIYFYKSSELTLIAPADQFYIKEDFYFADAQTFANQKIETQDTMSLQFYAITTLQQLIQFRLQANEPEALADADLQRLDFVKANTVNPNKEKLYFDFLQTMKSKYESYPISTMIDAKIAEYYYNSASKFDARNSLTFQYKNYRQTAHAICVKAIKNFPNSEGANQCLTTKTNIEQHQLTVQTEQIVPGNENFPLSISYQNINKVYIRVAAVDMDEVEKLQQNYYEQTKFYDKLLAMSKMVYRKDFNLPDEKDFNPHNTEVVLDKLEPGTYVVFAANNANFSYQKNMTSYLYLTVTNLSYISQKEENGNLSCYALHRKTGMPLSGVSVYAYTTEWSSTARKYVKKGYGNYVSDKNGFFLINAKKSEYSSSIQFDLKLGSDKWNTDNTFYMYQSNPTDYWTSKITIFTDRAIYRPGQTVYFKGIYTSTNNDQNKIIANENVNVVFYDANYQKVADVNVRTNEYGTFNGTFTIPNGLLNGNFQIYTSIGSKYIKVEEYKRPKFEALINPFTGNYVLEDMVTVTGIAKAYAGNNITDAQVKYRVVRKPRWSGWWYWSIPDNPVEILNGKTTTDEKGEYKIEFKALPDLSIAKSPFLSFTYQVLVDVTDLNGETQSTSGSLIVGYVGMEIETDLPTEITAQELDTLTIQTQNLNGEFLAASGTAKISKLKSNSEVLKNRLWTMPDTFLYKKEDWRKNLPGYVYENEDNIQSLPVESVVFEGGFNTATTKELAINGADKFAVGQYLLELKCKDAFGNDILQKKFFTIYNEKTTQLPYKMLNWFAVVDDYCEPGEKAGFLIGSGWDSTRILYQIEHKGKIVKNEWLTVSSSQQLIEIPIVEAYRGNVVVHFTYIRENRFYTNSRVVVVPYSNKKLDIEFATFRDKLQPGQTEEWQIKIKGYKGEKVASEMLATLYDASLDAFAKNNWDFSIFKSYYAQMPWSSVGFSTSTSTLLKIDFDPTYYYYALSYDYFNWYGFSYYNARIYRNKGVFFALKDGYRKTKSKKVSSADNDENEVYAEKEEDLSPKTEETKKEDKISPAPMMQESIEPEEPKLDELKDVKTRTNFNETAFFYPNLYTDENGTVTIKFTIPESLTRWKMMGFAHTKQLEMGWITNELVTQKDLMLMPNPPRFFREGDEIEFPVKISNISDQELNGNIMIEFLDAISLKPIQNIFAEKNENATKPFKVGAKLNTNLTWKLKIPEGISAITYRVVAKAGNFSDGEERPLPVLTNRMLVTESMPLPIRGQVTKVFNFEKLVNNNSSTLRNHKLTLEFTSNPAWYAVQALPYLMEYPYECIEQTFSRFYANSLATHIANKDPKVKRVFEAWKADPNSKALISNLEKNEDLKYALLQETPWVVEGQNETERKQRIGLLFDLNKMSNELEIALKKIIKGQAGNGGFPWFPGMQESRYITQHIVTGMGHLDHLGVKHIREDAKTWNMVQKAVDYLDYAIREDYDYLKRIYNEKEMKENHLGYNAIQYLYARSYFKDIEIPKRSKEAFEYFKSQGEKYWLSQSQYMQGMLALGLQRYENKTVAIAIVKSLKDNAIHHEELGMYWKEIEAGLYWYQAPIETMALMVEVFDEVANDQSSVNDLKVWLLKQKQTQDWKTTKATVEAIYALLLRGGDWLASDDMCKITVGSLEINKQNIPDLKTEAGTGYFRTSWYGSDIKKEMGKVTVVKKDSGVSWGALYWQYFEQLDKITPHETPLKINKKLFVERLTKSGPVIEPITEKVKLVIGDKIMVRIEIRVDRDMEYVHLKDMRSSGFEPINVISQYKYQGGIGYYESTKDASTNFFIDYLRKGTYVFEYPLRVQHAGDFSNGITTMQCMYAPEFTTHSEGIRVKVSKE